MSFQELLQKVQSGLSLSEDEAYLSLQFIFEGQLSEDKVETFLRVLYKKQETADELVGFSRYLQSQMTSVLLSKPAVDVCGTGGGHPDRFNISTASAFCCAAMGIPVAKHGNRGSKKANGSFDFIEALGIPILEKISHIQTLFDETDLCFLFARTHHPIVKKVAPIRQRLGHPSLFNWIGPLSNPAHSPYHILGTSIQRMVPILSEALTRLSVQKYWVFYNEDGSDELTGASTAIYQNHLGESGIFDPIQALGRSIPFPSGGLATENAVTFMRLLDLHAWQDPVIQTICLNAGITAYVLGLCSTPNYGFVLAQETFRSGKVLEKVNEVLRLSNQLSN